MLSFHIYIEQLNSHTVGQQTDITRYRKPTCTFSLGGAQGLSNASVPSQKKRNKNPVINNNYLRKTTTKKLPRKQKYLESQIKTQFANI